MIGISVKSPTYALLLEKAICTTPPIIYKTDPQLLSHQNITYAPRYKVSLLSDARHIPGTTTFSSSPVYFIKHPSLISKSIVFSPFDCISFIIGYPA